MVGLELIEKNGQELYVLERPGIYFLFDNNTLVYIGQSRDVATVVARHRYRQKTCGGSGRLPRKKFNRMVVRFCSKKRLDALEEACIVHFRPKYNRFVPHKKISAEKAERVALKFLVGE